MISVFATTTALLSNEFMECFPCDKLVSVLRKAGKESGITYSKTKKTFSITGKWQELVDVRESLQNLLHIELELECELVKRSSKGGKYDASPLSKKKGDSLVPDPLVFEYKQFTRDEPTSSASASQGLTVLAKKPSNNPHDEDAVSDNHDNNVVHEKTSTKDQNMQSCTQNLVDKLEIANDSSSPKNMLPEQNTESEFPKNTCSLTDPSEHNERDVVIKTEYYSDEDTEVESNIDYTELLDAAELKEAEKTHPSVEIKTEKNIELQNTNDKDIDIGNSKPAAKANKKSRRKSKPVRHIHSADTDSETDIKLADSKKKIKPLLTKRSTTSLKSKLKDTSTKQPKKRGRKKKKKIEEVGHFSCSQCEYVGTKKSNLKEHVKRQHREVMHECEVCGKKFGFNKDLMRHTRTVHVEPKFFCNHCNRFYKSKRVFDEHILTHDDDYIKPNFECDVCGKSFSTKYVLATHVKAEHLGLKKSYLCPTCGRSFTQMNSYRMHANVHLGIKPYVCDVCGKAFTYDKSLKEHKFMHDNIRRFTCSVCSKTFRQTTSLKIHMKVHKETKDYICTACGKGFTQKQALLRHERIHSGDKPYVCALCSRTFSDYSIIRRHMLLIHKKDPKEWRSDIISNLKKREDYYIDGGPGHHKRDMTGPTFDEKAKDEGDKDIDDPVTNMEVDSIGDQPETHPVTRTESVQNVHVHVPVTDENQVQDLSQTQAVFPGPSFSTDIIPQPSPAMSDSQISVAMPINYSLPQNYSSSVSSSPAPVTETDGSLASRYQSVVEAYRDLHAQRELYSPAMSTGTVEQLRSPMPYHSASPSVSEPVEEQIPHPQPPHYSYAGYPPYYNPANFPHYHGPQS